MTPTSTSTQSAEAVLNQVGAMAYYLNPKDGPAALELVKNSVPADAQRVQFMHIEPGPRGVMAEDCRGFHAVKWLEC